jgi:AraC-like DNA-binding protein
MARPWYTPVDPPDDLVGLLACAWTAQPTGRHRLTPDCCIDMLRLSSGQVLVCGPETKSWEFELPPSATAVGVRFRPGAAPSVLCFDASQIRNRTVRLSAIVDPAVEAQIDAELAACDDDDSRRDALVAWVRRRAGDAPRAEPLADAVLRCLVTRPHASRQQVAEQAGVSVRHLHRRSLGAFGYGTATLARLLRFQRLLAAADQASGSESLGVLAATAGYADQAHLARDCRAITGLTVTQFLADYFATFPDMSDPYKTNSSRSVTMER